MLKKFILKGNLVSQILIGIILGFIIAKYFPEYGQSLKILGDLFLTSLKSAAPILVFCLVISAIASHNKNYGNNMNSILILYFLSTFISAGFAVLTSFLFPTKLSLIENSTLDLHSPKNILDVLKDMVLSFVGNPIKALIEGNFICLLAWGIGLGLAFRQASKTTINFLSDLTNAITYVVRIIIKFAPLGIFGLVSSLFSESGFRPLIDYAHLLLVLIGTMLFITFIINPFIVYIKTKKNPYPLLFICLKESAITAFFTRSSAANIPVNLELCKKLGLNKDIYSVSIPLGGAINMAGASVTITILTLATVYSLGVHVDIFTAFLLCTVASLCACGASGVAGGSLLLIPLACNLFNIPMDIAMETVSIGLIIGIVQDSAETALNSHTDVLFTAASCISEENKK